MASDAALAAAMKFLAGAYPHVSIAPRTAESYAELLGGIQDQVLNRVVRELAAESRFFPSASEILARARRSWEPSWSLEGAREALHRQFFEGGRFEPQDWEELAGMFERADRPMGAANLRVRAEALAVLAEEKA